MWGDIAIAFLLAFITAFILTPYTIKIAKKIGAVDIPKDERRMHSKPMPKFGGPAIIVGFLVSTIYLIITSAIEGNLDLFGPEEYMVKLLGFLAGIIVLSIFCFFDDIKGIHPLTKLTGQLIATGIVVASGIRIDNFTLPFFDGKAFAGKLRPLFQLPERLQEGGIIFFVLPVAFILLIVRYLLTAFFLLSASLLRSVFFRPDAFRLRHFRLSAPVFPAPAHLHPALLQKHAEAGKKALLLHHAHQRYLLVHGRRVKNA